MTKGEALARIMDDAAQRVLSGTERPYDVAYEACAELQSLTGTDSDSRASWSAYLFWIEMTDVVEIMEGPAEQLCDELAGEFSRRWLALANREEESAQNAFMVEFNVTFNERFVEYGATNGLPPLEERPPRR